MSNPHGTPTLNQIRILRLLLCIATLAAAVIAGPGLGTAAAATPDAPAGGHGVAAAPQAPVRVRVGVYLLNVGRLDIGASTYSMDFYVSFRCDVDCEPGNFEILNGKATIEKNDDEPRFKVFRVRADLIAQFDLRSFPFDTHRLIIAMEDKVQQDNKIIYEPDLRVTGIHPSAVVVGWSLDKQWQVAVDRDSYAVYGQSYSRATFSIGTRRPKLSAFLKNLTPALIITLSGFLALLMGADKATPRLTLTTSSLVGSVLFHINMTSSMPPIGYLTFADRLMLINYIGLAAVLVVNVRVLALSEAGQTELVANRLRQTRYSFLAAFVLAHVVHALTLS